MNEVNEFREADEKGRILFQHYCERTSWCKFIKAANKDEAVWDVAYYSGSTRVVGEIKKRDYECTAFPDWMIHTKKVNALKDVRQTIINKNPNEKPPVIQYINIYSDKSIRFWDITNCHDKGIEQLVKDTTYGSQKDKVKQTIYLKNFDAILCEPLNSKKFYGETDNDEEDNLPF
jgi:hypothetical protein